MTFAEAMLKSERLKSAVYLAIIMGDDAKKKAAIRAHIDFNPYKYMDELVEQITTEK